MKKQVVFLVVLTTSLISFGQNTTNSKNEKKLTSRTEQVVPKTDKDRDFQEFCQQHALTFFTSEKSFTTNGTIVKKEGIQQTPSNYGIELLEERAQVYAVEGQPNTFVKVESIFRLRLMYNSIQKK